MDPSELLKMLDEFYSNAFSQLVTLAIAIFGIGGVIFPLVLSFFQSKTIKSERENILTQLKSSSKIMQEEMEKSIERKFDVEKEKILNVINRKTETLKGLTFFQQAIRCTTEKDYITAAMSYCWTINSLLTGNDESNAIIALNNLTVYVFPNLFKEDFEDEDNLDVTMNDLLEKLKESNINGRYDLEIRKVNKLLRKAKKTPKPIK